jgi:putative endonuclease
MIIYKNFSLKEKGKLAEEMAVSFLKKKGFIILEKNWYFKKIGEIDIIALKDKVLNFVEVKSLIDEKKFTPEQHFSFDKFLRITKLAHFYANQSKYEKWIISLIAVILDNLEVRYYENLQF